jgi:uncharacterized protein YkwD
VPESGHVRGASCIAIAAMSLAAGSSAAPAAAATPCRGTDALPAATTVTATRSALACLIDRARAERDLPALHVDARLQRAAQRYARQLKPARPLAHKGSGGSTPLERVAASGYPRGTAFTAAETLGRSHGTLAAPATRVAHWLSDKSTRRLLMSGAYRDIGIGVVTSGDLTTFVVEVAKRTPAGGSGDTP